MVKREQGKAGPAIGKSMAGGAIGQLGFLGFLKAAIDSYGTVPGERIYTDIRPREEQSHNEVFNILNDKKPHQRGDWTELSPDNVNTRMGITGTPEPSQKQLLAGEPDLKFLNKSLFNSILTDHKRQVDEGINPQDVLSGEDLSKFYNEIYAPGVDPKQALQNIAEKLFIQRGVESALKKSKSDSSGKIQSFNQKTIKGKDPHRITQKASKLTLPPEIRQGLTEEELIQLGIKRKAPVKTTMGSGFGGFSGFGKKQ